MLKGAPNPYTLFFTNPVTGKFEYPNEFLAKFPWRQVQLLKMVLYTNGQVHRLGRAVGGDQVTAARAGALIPWVTGTLPPQHDWTTRNRPFARHRKRANGH